MIKKLLFISFVFLISKTFSQEINLDKYQYIIVPEKFDFVNEIDKYQTSSLTKFLLEKKGFKVFLSNETMPEALAKDRCKSLFAEVKDKSSMLTTKAIIEVKDCFGKTVYASKIGKTKFKEYKRGYQDAIRKAFETMTDFNYSYNPDVVNISKELKEVKEKAPKVKENKLVKETKNIEVNIESPKPNKIIKTEKVTKKVEEQINSLPILYAQPKEDGYQLINTKPEVVFIILRTSKSDFYIIKNKSGTLYKNDEVWVAEYYENGTLKKENYQIKF